ncbi:MAG: hypothetical protein WC308_03900 [archaeon]|jgi:hypothetical protein
MLFIAFSRRYERKRKAVEQYGPLAEVALITQTKKRLQGLQRAQINRVLKEFHATPSGKKLYSTAIKYSGTAGPLIEKIWNGELGRKDVNSKQISCMRSYVDSYLAESRNFLLFAEDSKGLSEITVKFAEQKVDNALEMKKYVDSLFPRK